MGKQDANIWAITRSESLDAFATSDQYTILAKVIAIIALAYALILQFGTSLNHDAAWHMQTSLMWLEGGQIGKDVVDFNPPMTLWISSIPSLLHVWTGLSPALLLKAYVFVLLAISFFFSWIVLHSAFSMSKYVFLACFICIMVLYPGYHFGQREHLSLVLVLPYLLLSATFPNDRPGGAICIVAGMLAVFGVGIKPYFVILPMLTELTVSLRTRKVTNFLRIETILLAIGLFAYLGAVYIFARPYLTEVLPKAFWSYEYFEGARFRWVTLGPALLFAGTTFWLMKDRKVTTFMPIFWVLFAAMLAYAIAASLQNKGWEYQWMPVIMAAMLAATLVALFPQKFRGTSVVALISIFVLVNLGPALGWTKNGLIGGQDYSTRLRVEKLTKVIEKNAQAEDYIYGFITSPRDIHPVVLETNMRWADSAGALLFTPAILSGNSNELSKEVFEAIKSEEVKIIRNLELTSPRILIFNAANRLAISDDAPSYIEHFSSYPEFTEFFQAYEQIEWVGSFEIWVRR